MARTFKLVVTVGAAALLAGCSMVSDTLFPSTTATNPSQRQVSTIPPSAAESNPAPTLSAGSAVSSGSFQPPPVTPGSQTGTEVGRKVQSIRDDVGRLPSA